MGDLHAVANDKEAVTEETGLDKVEKGKGKSQSCLIQKTQPLCRISETVYVWYKWCHYNF